MSSARTSSGSDQTVLPASRVTTALSSVSTVSLPGPTHTPSQTPVIAGSLTGVIVLVVCLVTFLLLHKRRRRLCTGCIRRATQQDSSSQNFFSNHLRTSPHLRCFYTWTSSCAQINPIHSMVLKNHYHLIPTILLPRPDRSQSLRSPTLDCLMTTCRYIWPDYIADQRALITTFMIPMTFLSPWLYPLFDPLHPAFDLRVSLPSPTKHPNLLRAPSLR